MGGPSGFGSPCEGEHGFFVESGYGSRGCGEGLCNPLEQSGACCSSCELGYRNLCFDDMPPSKCAAILGSYYGDGSECTDSAVYCMRDVDDDVVVRCCFYFEGEVSASLSRTWAECLELAASWGSSVTIQPSCTFGCPRPGPQQGVCCWCDPDTGYARVGLMLSEHCGELGGSYWGDNVMIRRPSEVGNCDVLGAPGCPVCSCSEGAVIGWPGLDLLAPCYTIGTAECDDTNRYVCAGSNQTWGFFVEECADNNYPGACCFGSCACVDNMPRTLCEPAGGTWQGQETICDEVEC